MTGQLHGTKIAAILASGTDVHLCVSWEIGQPTTLETIARVLTQSSR